MLEETKVLTMVWGKDLGESKISDAWKNPEEKIYLRRAHDLGPEEGVSRRDQEYGSDGILVMGVYMPRSQQEKDCHTV